MADQDLNDFTSTSDIADADQVAIRKGSDGLWRKMTGADLKALFLSPATTSTDPGLAFDTWRTPNANRPTLVTVRLRSITDGTTPGRTSPQVDEGGGTTADYSFTTEADPALGSGGLVVDNITFYVPAGGSYQISNVTDPAGTNAISAHREFTL